ncbi:hypothetical protein GCM10010404_47590 [Nonomuraea africana]|uniref:Uncharacterized protein n=1 Tax=Nonomuraea africana TaxID=46171 RepID=A0ABR9KWA3_9ACTN|nr:hypothetical protein [Nonomuraea africana]MBE1566275.1 hypothetical protein [Nonomuraea africana]
MLAFALGLAWLVLSPLCLWFLVRGRHPARIGAVLTLVAMEAATVVVSEERESRVVVAYDVPAAAQQPAMAECVERTPVPQAARLGRRHERLRLYWAAASDECRTADVVLRRKGRELRVWVSEGAPQGRWEGTPQTHHEGARTVPVHVEHSTASLALTLDLPDGPRYVTVDGRSGNRIPLSR